MKSVKLILMGAGTVYPIHVGAILRLAEEGYVFSEVSGSSWGSLVAAALGTGYAANTELTKFVKKTLPSKHSLIQQSYWSLYTKWGTVKTKKLNQFLLDFFVSNLENMRIPVNFLATDVSDNTIHSFNARTDPGMKVATALSASMSIPMFMEPAKINGKYYVDGAQASKFPMNILGNTNEVIVLRAESTANPVVPVSNIKNYISASVNSWVGSHSSDHIPKEMLPRTIRLKTVRAPFDLSLTDSDVDFMVSEGYMATDAWLRTNK